MELTAETLVPQSVGQREIIEIKLWEVYLLNHPTNLYKVLTELSLDGGPVEVDHELGRVVFRFKVQDWENQVRPLLYQQRIPVIFRSSGFRR